MVYRWRCRHCGFASWTPGRDQASEAAKSHLLTHYTENIRREDARLGWACPHCGTTDGHQDRDRAVTEFKRHLFDHAEVDLAADVHLADEFGGTGSVLVKAPLESTGADSARVHLLTPTDVYVFVTQDPTDRLRLIMDKLPEWPTHTVVITTTSRPLSDIDSVDLETASIEVVQLTKRLGLSRLRETIGAVLDEHEATGGKISLEFDILSEILRTFDLREAVQFLYAFTKQCARSDVLSHYYLDPKSQSTSVINVVEDVFDVRVEAEGVMLRSPG
jgi:hypothetical protein